MCSLFDKAPPQQENSARSETITAYEIWQFWIKKGFNQVRQSGFHLRKKVIFKN